ncbi:hypothetical protein QQF64_020389 [Cirrhinus molitorella]|uniref:Uncharacterized protein n=2 Tax=Cirrhinus molitorella TaxID=172907 RepID=A0AA88TT19_9TELE|nr:hypothetical protein Q8A67_017011 [Cirrhinus molitorella]
MILFVVVTFWIGIAAYAAVASAAGVEDDNEIESLTVFEGGNLTISIHIEKSDKDLQILLIHGKGSSKELIAQIICNNGTCEKTQKWRSISLKSDGENVTLSLMNVSYNQTGLYEVRQPSSKRHENNIYKVTVCEPPLSSISPEKTASAMYSESHEPFIAGISAGAVVLALVVIVGAAIFVIYRKPGKGHFGEVPQERDTEDIRWHRSQRDCASYL